LFDLTIQRGDYLLTSVVHAADLHSAQKLRYQVFNIELEEGLLQSNLNCLDTDEFDAICEHLLVKHIPTDTAVGTYRMQTGILAKNNLGYYSAREFNLESFETLRKEIVELGRACIAKDHRNYFVLSLLWQGIAKYAQENGARYLIGCSSLTSQNPVDAKDAYQVMQKYLAPKELYVEPSPGFECISESTPSTGHYKIPKLLSAYLSLGAWICGPPAIDREFKTIDFLTMLDLKGPQAEIKLKRFLSIN
jgi:putative hemolysin